jgi:hypothetical protein
MYVTIIVSGETALRPEPYTGITYKIVYVFLMK